MGLTEQQVQGVKGNAEKDAGTDVDSIVERIKKGELKLPPSSTKYPSSTFAPDRTQSADSSELAVNTLPTSKATLSTTKTTYLTSKPTYPTSKTTYSTSKSTSATPKPTYSSFKPTIPTTRSPQVSVSPNSVSSTDKYVTSASSITGHVLNSISTTAKPHVSSHVTVKYPSSQYTSSLDSNEIVSSTTPSSNFGHSSTYVDYSTRPATASTPTRVSTFSTPSQSYAGTKENLGNLLRREGLFAMAKYLRQSGLDNVLNETGNCRIRFITFFM